jgi:hypothetical protein
MFMPLNMFGIVVSVRACHGWERGSIPRLGEIDCRKKSNFLCSFSISNSLQELGDDIAVSYQ